MKVKRLFAAQIIVLVVALFSTMNVYGEHKDNIYIRINLWTNELIVSKNNEVIKRFSIASGTEESPTPIGLFKVKEKSKSWRRVWYKVVRFKRSLGTIWNTWNQ